MVESLDMVLFGTYNGEAMKDFDDDTIIESGADMTLLQWKRFIQDLIEEHGEETVLVTNGDCCTFYL